MKSRKSLFRFSLFVVFLAVLGYHQVSWEITPSDKKWWSYYQGYLLANNINPYVKLDTSLAKNVRYHEELRLISCLQKDVQKRSPVKGRVIPQRQERNLENVLSDGKGMCYDRAYTLEKLFRQAQFEVRHVALYRNNPQRANWRELLSKEIKSHASLEVKTTKGWLIVEPDHPWLGLTKDSLPQNYQHDHIIDELDWLSPLPEGTEWHLQHNAIEVYGLYARHGNFFPPYNFIPDINWWEMMYNLRSD